MHAEHHNGIDRLHDVVHKLDRLPFGIVIDLLAFTIGELKNVS
jgi:hypothetical protein